MPRIARVLLKQTHQNQGPSFSKINLTSKTYNGEWALVGEFVKQLGGSPSVSFASCPREYLLFGGGGAGNQDYPEEIPSRWPCYRITFANNQQLSVLWEQRRIKRRDAKQRDDPEARGVVSHLPTATAETQRIQTGRSNVGKRFANAMSGIAQTGWRRPTAIIAATPFFMGIAALKFKSGDMKPSARTSAAPSCFPGPKDCRDDHHLGGQIAELWANPDRNETRMHRFLLRLSWLQARPRCPPKS